MGMSTTDAKKCIRLSLSKFTTADEVNQAAQWLVKAIV
jgi:cysteine sulfinate desulfinase/cysteine desulfurase-like protein